MNWKDAKKRGDKTRSPPQTGIALDLNILLATAQKLGGIQGACLAHKISWAAFYTEKKKFDEMKAAFLSNLKIEVTHAKEEANEANFNCDSEKSNVTIRRGKGSVSIRTGKARDSRRARPGRKDGKCSCGVSGREPCPKHD